MFVVGLWFI